MVPAVQSPMSLPPSLLTLRGAPTREDLRHACLRLAQQGPVQRLLVDTRGITDERSEADRVQLASHLVVFFPGARVALLAHKDRINHVAEAVATRAGMTVQLFWREEAALAWLAGPGDGR